METRSCHGNKANTSNEGKLGAFFLHSSPFLGEGPTLKVRSLFYYRHISTPLSARYNIRLLVHPS